MTILKFPMDDDGSSCAGEPATRIVTQLRDELAQCATELQEAANIMRGTKLFGCASLYDIAAQRVRAVLVRLR